MELFRWIFTGILCGGAFLAASGFLLSQFLRGVHVDAEMDDSTFRRQSRRRLGAGLVALISAVFFVGVNWIDPRVDVVSYVWMWALVTVLLLWLILLALLDARQTLLEHHRRRETFQQELQSWLRTRKDG